LALSGGIFANVKLNKKINELDLFDEIFVLPPMGDEGLALGCAVGVISQIEPDFKPLKFNDVFLGTEYGREEIMFCGKDFKKDPFYLNVVVNLLLDKKIVGLYQGRSESGPRALGE
jgi:carbamoyltransferase